MSLLQEIIFSTIKTIKSFKKLESFEENLNILKDLTKKLSLDYLKINPNLKQCPITLKKLQAPVIYTEIYHTPHFSVGVFVLRPGSRMPTHNHPHMHGILKVLHGTALVKSFNVHHSQSITSMGAPLLKILEQTSMKLTADSDAVILTPNNGNIHAIHPLLAPTAFLDILFPSYDNDERFGQYYKQVSLLSPTNQPISPSYPTPNQTIRNDVLPVTDVIDDVEGMFLEEIAAPGDYWCDLVPYEGPQLPRGFVEKLLEKDDL